MNSIKFVYFDLGGVLFRWKGGIQKIVDISGKSWDEVYGVFKKYDQIACKGQISPDEFWNNYKKELHFDYEINNFIDFWTDQFIPIRESHELLKELSKYYKIGILTNIYKGTFEKAIEKGKIPNLNYSEVIKSCDEGLVKPDEKIYKLAQEKAKFQTYELLLIDDGKINIEAAKKMGWNAIYFEDENLKKTIDDIKDFLLY